MANRSRTVTRVDKVFGGIAVALLVLFVLYLIFTS